MLLSCITSVRAYYAWLLLKKDNNWHCYGKLRTNEMLIRNANNYKA